MAGEGKAEKGSPTAPAAGAPGANAGDKTPAGGNATPAGDNPVYQRLREDVEKTRRERDAETAKVKALEDRINRLESASTRGGPGERDRGQPSSVGTRTVSFWDDPDKAISEMTARHEALVSRLEADDATKSEQELLKDYGDSIGLKGVWETPQALLDEVGAVASQNGMNPKALNRVQRAAVFNFILRTRHKDIEEATIKAVRSGKIPSDMDHRDILPNGHDRSASASGTGAKLTGEEREVARRFDLTDEEYHANRQPKTLAGVGAGEEE